RSNRRKVFLPLTWLSHYPGRHSLGSFHPVNSIMAYYNSRFTLADHGVYGSLSYTVWPCSGHTI
ncbi:MAG TPA: hypothetical protein PKM17_10480, partial [Syntrophorhabdus sp.]|nr:hypothetical protein [Syntrophorhabdus sp.]